MFDVHPDARTFAFTAALCLLTVILFGLIPAFRGSKVALSPTLTARSPGGTPDAGRFGLHKVLVVLQGALTLPLLIGPGLFVRSLRGPEAQDH